MGDLEGDVIVDCALHWRRTSMRQRAIGDEAGAAASARMAEAAESVFNRLLRDRADRQADPTPRVVEVSAHATVHASAKAEAVKIDSVDGSDFAAAWAERNGAADGG